MNLSEDWEKLFGSRYKEIPKELSTASQQVLSSEGASMSAQPRVQIKQNQVQAKSKKEKIDLVLDSNNKKDSDDEKGPSEKDWRQYSELSDVPISEPIPIKNKPNRKTQPVVLGNKMYTSNNTAIWAQVRKNTYPLYNKFCLDNKQVPNVADFNKLISSVWKKLSQEDKIKAAKNPEQYFTFN